MADNEDLGQTADLIQGANPFVGMDLTHLAGAGGRWAAAAARHPLTALWDVLKWGSEEAKVLAGTSTVKPDPKDKRFGDPAWERRAWKSILQAYLVSSNSLLESTDHFGLDPKSSARARFALAQVVDATAPTNTLLGNPAALKRTLNTRGRSLVDGVRQAVHDLRNNAGMPSQVDGRPFRVGETVATTRGEVIDRHPMFELLQYEPATARVATRPTLILPPQINRFYFLDLAPGRSFVQYAVGRGIPMYLISWRNPTPAERCWGLDAYVSAVIEAIEVVSDVSGSESVNLAGFCAGGMTQCAVLSYLAAMGSDMINAFTLAVTLLDTEITSTLNMFSTERTLNSVLAKSRRKGILSGRELARAFAWVRPNDLIWNYWVSNYLLGEDPPAFDVLAWNADSTNLPAALHAEFIHMWKENALMHAGRTEILGTPLDLSTVKQDAYVIGAVTDHLVPWQSAYRATQVLGGHVRYVLSNSGHIQALINPPGNPKASFYTNDGNPAEPDAWLAGAVKTNDSWWVDWADWTLARSGPRKARPRHLGNERHPRIVSAPGEYVRH